MTSNKFDESVGVNRRSMLGGVAGGLAGLTGLTVGSGTAAAQGGQEGRGRRRFENKVVAITGATSGIGKAAAIAFAREGAKVGFCGRREQLGREVERTIRQAGGDATYFRADVRVEREVQAFMDGVVRRYGRMDIAFNNAGINWFKPLHETTTEQWDDMQNTNTRGVFLSMKYQVPHMLRQGAGIILITGSVQQVATRPGGSAYGTSKRSLISLAQAATLDYATKGIRVNVLAPGTTDTPIVRNLFPGLTDEEWRRFKAEWGQKNVPGMQRMAEAEEMAAAALALASDDFSYLTGASLLVDGGMTTSL